MVQRKLLSSGSAHLPRGRFASQKVLPLPFLRRAESLNHTFIDERWGEGGRETGMGEDRES